MSAARPDWIAVDWGTSHLRVWAMTDAGAVLDEARSEDGMGGLPRDGFEPALLRLVAPWLDDRPVQAVVCGMAGSRQGWAEAPYRATPCPARTESAVKAPAEDPRLDVRLIPGIKQDSPADVMRGEETQIAGYLSGHPGFDGVLCLPGTHSKWVQVSAGEIVSFRTFITGELFDLLAGRSVLRHSISAEGWDDAAFASAVSDTLSRPESLAAGLFGLRAEALLHGQPPRTARARLSGLLIGAELAAARPYWLGQPIILIGASSLTAHYAAALTALGAAPTIEAGDATTLAGLAAVRETLKDDP